MKNKLQRVFVMLTKFTLYGACIQMILYSFVFSEGITAQNIRNVKDVSLQMSIAHKIPLREALRLIERETSYKFSYDRREVDDRQTIQIGGNKTLYDHLLNISEQTNLRFRQINNTITIKQKKVLEEKSIEILIQTFTITGKVTTSEDHEGLPGVNVIVKGTAQGTVTDINGDYKIEVPSPESILVYSSVGFQKEEIVVGNKSVIDMTLSPDIKALQEIVVIGYGTQKKSDLTGSVSSMNSDAVDDRQPAATNVTELMRSAVPGLNVGIGTSAKGATSLEIRGPTSLGTNNSPLIVLDDVIYQGDITDINPVDIERIDVLKDASAAAIYGARAAAGVVIITTKKGVEGKPTINFRSSIGLAHVGKMEEVYGSDGYLQYRSDVLDRFDINSAPGYYSNPSNLPEGVTIDDWLAYDNLQGTTTPPEDIWYGRLQLQQVEIDNYKAGNALNWKDILFQTGLRSDNNISLSGRTDDLSYYTSLGYVNNDGILIYQNYKNFRARINLEAKINNFLSVGWNVQGSEEREPQGLPNSVSLYDRNSPLGSLYNEDGTYKIEPHDDALGGNPYIYEYKDNYYRQRQIFANIYGKITLPLGFSFRINWVNNYANILDYRFTPSIASLGEGGATGSRVDATHYDWMVDNILKWHKTIAEIHDFDVTLLYNIEENSDWSSSQSNSEFDPNESLTYHNLSIGSNPVISQNDTRSTGDAFMARLNYSLLNRYLLTLSVRRDGYSAFGQKNPYAVFPAVALGWRISDEKFANIDWLTNLKLRLSWGENGNRDIGQYVALSRMSTTKYIYDHSSVTGIYTTNLANEELKWERTATYNVGIDFGIFKQRISGSIDVYKMSTTDLLLERSLPNITGYESVFSNLGEVENRGFELALNTVNLEKSKFSWNSSLSFWFNRNKIKHLYGDMVDVYDDAGNVIGQKEDDDVQNGWYIGHGIDEIFDYKIIGIWQLDEKDEAGKYGRAPGDAKLWDKNGDGVINYDDKVFQGNTKPKFRISLRNDFVIGNFDMSFLLNSYIGYKGANNEHFNYRVGQERLNKIITPYWTVDNPTNEWTRLYSNNFSPEGNWWENKSFVRLQNVTVGYTVPTQFLKKLDIEKLRLYGNIQDLPAISDWQYNWDVETSSPTPVIYTFGIDLSF